MLARSQYKLEIRSVERSIYLPHSQVQNDRTVTIIMVILVLHIFYCASAKLSV